jgi:hypothetical protein
MKKSFLILVIAGFLAIGLSEIQAQTSQTESHKAGTGYNIFDVLSGIWLLQGEARDSISAPYYHVDWTLKSQKILNGYAIETLQNWKTKDYTQNGVEIDGYNPLKKVTMNHIFYDDGSWIYSEGKLTGKRTILETGTTYYPNGKTDIWRNTWNYSDDWMSLTIKYEVLKDENWITLWELKGTKENKK